MKRWLLLLCLLGVFPAAAADLAIVDARIYPSPGAAAIERGTVVLRDGRIAAVGPSGQVAVPGDARVLDGRGKVLVAGFWNSHVHLMSPAMLDAATRPAQELEDELVEMLTRWGFTTVFDIASFNDAPAALQRRIESGEISGPEILYVGTPFYPVDNMPIYIRDLVARLGVPDSNTATAEQARARAERQFAAGADGVKLFAGSIVGGEIGVMPMEVEIARAAVEAAHRHGKVAFAHPTDLAGLEVSLAAGVDVLSHTTPVAGPWDDALVARLVAANVALTPTLTLFRTELEREQVPQDVIESFVGNATQQTRALSAAGGDVLFGTDVGYIAHADTRLELSLMERAGMDWRSILASLTTLPAGRFGQDADKGRIAPGMQADLVLLGSDPAEGVAAFADVELTIRNGAVLFSRPAGPDREARRGDDQD